MLEKAGAFFEIRLDWDDEHLLHYKKMPQGGTPHAQKVI